MTEIKIDKNLFCDTAWFIAIGTSTFISAPISEIDPLDESTLLELRVFDENHEIKKIRGSLKDKFQKRDSSEIQCDKKRTEIQYLDIDTDNKNKFKCSLNNTWGIGGGEYRLPNDNLDRVVIEHYYKADDKGFYKPFDFRIVCFLKKEKKGEEDK